jgi:hypothetical protein
MKTYGKGTNGARPYRGDFSRERMAAASHDLDRAIARAKSKPPKITGLAHDFIAFDEADEISVEAWDALTKGESK